MIDPLKIHALADGELSAEETAELQKQIAECQRSCAELHAIRDLKDALAKTQPVTCDETWRGCVKRLNEIDKTRRIEFAVGRYAWGLCSLFFAAILVGGYFTRSGLGVVRSGDVARMVSAMQPFSSFKGDSPEAAKRWLVSNVKNMPMPDNRLRLVGGIVGETRDHQRHIAKLSLRDARGNVALIIIDPVNQVDGFQPSAGQYQQGTIDGASCVTWMDHDRALLLVGDRSPDELQSIASSIVIR